MQYTKLGRTGLDVSRVVLGCMTYGDPGRGTHPWTLDEDTSRPVIQRAVELGITAFDTANVYSAGSSEEILGRALADFARREEVVIATKVHGRMRPGANGAGLSRKAIHAEIDASLTRLGTDYVDLYQIHRWDPDTPIEETLEALHDVVKAGKARYLGGHRRCMRGNSPRPSTSRMARLDQIRVDAGPLQPAQPRGGAGDAAALLDPGSRSAAVEPAGPRSANTGLGAVDLQIAVRRVRQDALHHDRQRPHDRRAGGPGRRRTGCAASAGSSRLGAAQPGSNRSHRRRQQA